MSSNKALTLNAQRLGDLPRIGTMALAVLVVFVVFNFRADMHPTVWPLLIEQIFQLAIPVAFFCWVLRHSESKPFEDPKWIQRFQVAAIPYAFLPVLLQPIMRMFDVGDPNEIIALSIVTNVMWYLAVFSAVSVFERTSFVLGAALILFTCFMSQEGAVFVLAFFYAVIALWWMFGNYWSKVSTKAIDGHARMLPVRGLAIGISLGVLVIVGAITWAIRPSFQLNSVRGFMPTSGGDRWTQEFARSGIGDGDMLVGGPNATTTGAVDTDQFIEDERPSMYDINGEKFDGPMKIKKRRNRAEALDATAKHLHQVIRSEQTGRSFRTVRKSPSKQRKLENRHTDALFFVEGQVPARFAVDCFHHFDGYDWSKVDLTEHDLVMPRIKLEMSSGKPWYVVQNQQRQFLESKQAHRVKIMRLDTNSLPAPPMIKSWHIYRVDTKSMFYWNDQEMICMQGEMIPSHTMIDMFSKVPNYYVLENSRNPLLKDHPHPIWDFIDSYLGTGEDSGTSRGKFNPFEDDPTSPYIQVPDNETKARIKTLVEEWTEGFKPGWQQVDAIVQKLRNDFVYDPQITASDDGRDAVASFLDQGGGPSYLFATVATQMLRTAGYRARLTSGFLVKEEDYDRVARQSIVMTENAHMWPEICLDGWHWIPVEPTPGFPEPVNAMTTWQRIKTMISNGIIWMWQHPIRTGLFLTVCGLIAWYRRELMAGFYWLTWLGQVLLMPQRRLKATRQLIDAWFWTAGVPRPKFSTIGSWWSQVQDTSQFRFIDYWQSQNFSSDASTFENKQVYRACVNVASALSFWRIRSFANQKRKEK